MELQYSELNNNIRMIKFIGKLDIAGVGQIETRFTGYCGGEKARVIVDCRKSIFLPLVAFGF